jgi:hypothetical protein
LKPFTFSAHSLAAGGQQGKNTTRVVAESAAATGWLRSVDHVHVLLLLLLLLLLQVMEDVTEGYVVTGLSSRAAKNATELRSDFNSGRANRDTQVHQC